MKTKIFLFVLCFFALALTQGFSQSNKAAIVQRVDGKFHLVSAITKKPVHTLAWDTIGPFRNGFAKVSANGKYSFINEQGIPVSSQRFDAVKDFVQLRAAVSLNKKWGFIDPAGNIIVPLQYDNVSDFTTGEALACSNDVCNWINTKGATVQTPTAAARQSSVAGTPVLNNQTPARMLSANTLGSVPCPENIDLEKGNFQNWQTNIGTTVDVGTTNILNLPASSWKNNANTSGRQELQDRQNPSPAVDYYGGFPVNAPNGGRYSMKIGSHHDEAACVCPNAKAEAARYKIDVPRVATDYSITFSYAVVLENPNNPGNFHDDYQQPRFKVTMYDAVTNEVIPCADFTFVASGPLPGFQTSTKKKRADAIVRYKDWSSVYVNLSRYAGRELYLEFTTGDCTEGGHFGYAYVDVMECGIGATAQAICSSNSTLLTGPPGFQSYEWYDETFTNKVGTGQVVTVSPGAAVGAKYWAIINPYPNSGCPTCVCKDTVAAQVQLNYPVANAGPDKAVCEGTAVRIGTPAVQGYSYQWSPATGLSDPLAADPLATALISTQYTLTITDNLTGCTAKDAVNVNVYPIPIAGFTVNSLAQCINSNRFAFTNTTVNASGTATYQWDFGDGTTSTLKDPVHVYTRTGSFTVRLNVIGANGCSNTITQTIVVSPKPTPSFVINRTNQCLVGNSFSFNNNSSGASAYTWDFGDGVTASQPNATHVYTQAGNYTVKLVAINSNGCKDSLSRQVVVDAIPMVGFSINAPALCLNATGFSFTNSSAGNSGNLLYQWDFGDGNSSTATHPSHVYRAAGTYMVTLTTSSLNGCTVAASKPVTVYPKPSPAFTVNALGQCMTGNNFAFTNNSSILSGSLQYTWSFGDGNTTAEVNPVHRYALPGSYPVKLVVSSDKGCKDSLVQTVNVYTQPKASFTINAQAQCVNTNSFAFTSTSTAGLGTLTYNWDFGDGTISSLAAPVHTYALEGTYTIKLIVTSSNGCKDSATQTVTLYPKPSPLFVISDAAQCLVGNSFSFTNGSSISSGSITSYWAFNDGTTSLEKEPSHIYIQAGNYAPKLVVISDKGCKDSLTRPLIVHANPLVKIQANKNIALCKGSTVQLNVTGAQSYTWNPADYLSCTTCSDPVAAPVAGSIMYTVIGKNAADCPGQDSVRIQVIPPFTIQTANDTICLNESARLNATGAVTYNWSPATGLSSTTIVNPLASPAVTTTYRVVGYDGFNCFTDTAYAKVVVLPTPVVNLGPDLNLSTGTLQPLTNSIQNGPITRWIWSPQKDLSCTDCPLPTAYIRNEVSYRVHVTNTYGCSNADTINIKAFCESGQLYIANAFTPDGDGINDILMVQGKGIASIKSFRIFNRWGELLFEKMNFAPNDPKHGWDGKIKGRSGPSDVFVYTAEVICENGTPFFFKGNISILK